MLQSFGKPAPGAEDTSGKDFDRMWLQMTIDHHTGAITTSDTELTGGTNPEVKALALKITNGQQAEIDQMHTMVNQS